MKEKRELRLTKLKIENFVIELRLGKIKKKETFDGWVVACLLPSVETN